MQAIEITIEKITKLFEFYENYNKLKEESSNEISKAKMNAKRKIKYKNEFLDEQVLWDEILYNGPEGEAGKIMSIKYPKAFELDKKQKEAGKLYEDFCMVELGINFTAIKLSDIVRLCLGVVDYKLKNLPKTGLFEEELKK